MYYIVTHSEDHVTVHAAGEDRQAAQMSAAAVTITRGLATYLVKNLYTNSNHSMGDMIFSGPRFFLPLNFTIEEFDEGLVASLDCEDPMCPGGEHTNPQTAFSLN